jgi:hypothetical protein
MTVILPVIGRTVKTTRSLPSGKFTPLQSETTTAVLNLETCRVGSAKIGVVENRSHLRDMNASLFWIREGCRWCRVGKTKSS